MSPRCPHPATVQVDGTADERCLDCGVTILNTGETQPGLFPADDVRAARAQANRSSSSRKARELLNLNLFGA